MRGGETITYIFIDKYLGGGRSAVSLILIIGLEVWRGVLFAGLFVWAVEAGLGPFSQNVSSVNLGVWGAEGCGCVRDSATVSKGSRPDDADGNPVLLVRQRHGGVQLAWRVFVVGKQTEIWRGRWGRLQN